ncbi:unnamed protein product [Notodromas monacha]|uniref:Scavenger receptor class B member 1 n=2 Tax=Notodromas monacha TaxID=399045 RepID=A0A7R9GEA7_9CRUS|nr:unnamed protein product [Notodromas monacha]CAG0919554.1 unnamed protein product [Notodromas monacha]
MQTMKLVKPEERYRFSELLCMFKAWAAMGATGVVALIFGLLTVVYFQDLITMVIHKELEMKNGSEPLELYLEPPVEPITKVYFFNLTNAEKTLSGDIPILEEVGPYVYREKWEKVVDKFDDKNKTVTFRLKTIKYFMPRESAGKEDDIIMTVNVPMMAAVYKLKYGSSMMRVALSSMFTTILKVEPFMPFKVGDLLWGYDDPLLRMAKDIMPPGQTPPFDKFGFLYDSNGTSKENLTTYTGVGDIARKGLIKDFDGMTQLPFWAEDSCNAIHGSDGSAFPPDIDTSKTLYIFNPKFCRAMPLVYDGDVFHDGIRTARMTPPEDAFDVAQPDNACFCLDPPDCAPKGLFNISACQFGSPVYMSWPHFYQGEKKLLQQVQGLSPEKEKHQFYVDLEPKLGLPLSVQARLQVNIQLQSIWEVKGTRNMRNTTFPILWMESGIEKMPQFVHDKVHQAIEMPEVVEAAATYTLFIVGLVLVIVVGAFFVHKKVAITKRTPKIDTSTSTTTFDGLIHTGGVTDTNSTNKLSTNGQHKNGNGTA